MTALSDDLEAIDRYMKETPLHTKEAARLRDEWIKWWDGLWWFEKQTDSNLFDIARNKKNAFNLANARDPIERADIKESLKTAVTSEELRGDPRRMLSDGSYDTEKEPFFPTRVKVLGGALAAAFVGLWALKKIYVEPVLRR